MAKRMGLPFNDWPAADRAVWDRAFLSDGFFSDRRTAVHWRPATRRKAISVYGCWLTFLIEHFPTVLKEAAGARVTPERLRAFAESLAQRMMETSVASTLGHLVLALSLLAPKDDWKWLRRVQYRYKKTAQPRDKRGNIVHGSRLLELGIRLMDTAASLTHAGKAALSYRDGLIIALLACVPLRRSNLAEIEVGDQLQSEGTGFTISIDRAKAKGRQPLEFEVPAVLTPYLQRYLEDHRLRFPGAAKHRGLWPSMQGAPLAPDGIYDVVCRRTQAAFGFKIHPHLFRDIAATTIGRDAPEQVLIARDILGHARLDTTVHHYSQAKTLVASRQHASNIAALRANARRPSKRSRTA